MRRHRCGGQELVEYALLLPLLMLLLLGIMEFGIAVMSYDTIANAAREGARYGITHAGDSAGVETATRRLTSGLDQTNLQVTVSFPMYTTRVELAYDHTFISAMIIDAIGGNPTLHMTTVATMRIE